MPAHTKTVPAVPADAEEKLFVAIDLGSTRWQLAMTKRTSEIVRRVAVDAGDLKAMRGALARGRARFGLHETAPVLVCSEAGRDGFWVHRWLEAEGLQSLVIDPGSVEISGRARRAKTDRLDAELLLRSLLRWEGGDRHAFRCVRVPSQQAEDARLLHRQRDARVKDRTRSVNRIKGLLATHGVKVDGRLLRRLERELDTLRGADGHVLSDDVKSALRSELELLRLCERQIAGFERQMREATTVASAPAAQKTQHLSSLRGVGVLSAWVLVHELFGWRVFSNRRELASAAGLVPVPHHSDQSRRELGVSKAGNHRVRKIMNQLAWLWIRYQPESALTKWYNERWGGGSSRQRRVGIVALERKLLIALWRFVTLGLVPSGARLSLPSSK